MIYISYAESDLGKALEIRKILLCEKVRVWLREKRFYSRAKYAIYDEESYFRS